MAKKKYGPLGYIFSGSLLAICLVFMYFEIGVENESNLNGLVYTFLFFVFLSTLWAIIGMISLVAEGSRGRLFMGLSMLLFQISAYYWLFQELGIKIGEISF